MFLFLCSIGISGGWLQEGLMYQMAVVSCVIGGFAGAMTAVRRCGSRALIVGLAVGAVFFLLLTSLSEHIAFSLAYLAAAAGSILLIGIYLASILHGWRRGIGFSGALTMLYAALFGILRSEQNALLLGSLLLFVALAGLMLSTRKIDWYRLGKQSDATAEKA